MVLIYENDPLDNEDARGRFFHVCQGRIVRTELQLPSGESVGNRIRRFWTVAESSTLYLK